MAKKKKKTSDSEDVAGIFNNIWKGKTKTATYKGDDLSKSSNAKTNKELINQLDDMKSKYKTLENKLDDLKEQAKKVPELEEKVKYFEKQLIKLLSIRVDNIEHFLKKSIKDDELISDEAKQLYHRITTKYSNDR